MEDLEYKQFLTRFNDIQNGYSNKESLPFKHCQQNMWLIKPAALNQGKGIEVCRSLKEIHSILKAKPMHSVWLAQKYLERPLLFHGRKFDIRVWAFGTAKHELFYYRHGYLRTSSSEYDTSATDNYIHLTNNCLQKHGENYGVYEKGNTLSFSEFQEYLNSKFPEYNLDFYVHILPRIKDLIIDSYLSAKKAMHKGKRNKVFEFFGFDFLIDEDFRVWLIEVNTNPYLGVPNEYIKGLLPLMLDDLFSLVLDPHIPPKNPRTRQENDYELLYCEVASIYSSDGLSKNYRHPYKSKIYPVPELSQIPMHKLSPANAKSKPEDEIHIHLDIKPKDLLQTVKDLLAQTILLDTLDFFNVCSRIMSQLNNWEIMSEDQNFSALQSLVLIVDGPGAAALVVYGHMPSIYNLCVSENFPLFIQTGVLEAIEIACQDTKFRKEIVKLGIAPNLINYVLDPNAEQNLKQKAFKAMLVISKHPTRDLYIPGETRDHNWIRHRIISEGLLLCFYKLGQDAEESVKKEVKHHLINQYGLSDWQFQLSCLDKILSHSSSNSVVRASSVRFTHESSNNCDKNPNGHFPDVLNNPEFLASAKTQIKNFCESKKTEIKNKLEKEKIKKFEEDQEKARLKELEARAHEEKRIKAEEYANKRFEEIRKYKLEDTKNKKDSKDDKFDQEKKNALIEKLKKIEEAKRLQKIKVKKEEEDYKQIEELKKKKTEEKRKKVIEEWLRNKTAKEREIKILEKIKKEEETAKRNLDLEARRQEFFEKIKDRKEKNQKIKETNQEKKKKVDDPIHQNSSKVLLEESDTFKNIVFQNLVLHNQLNPNPRSLKSKK